MKINSTTSSGVTSTAQPSEESKLKGAGRAQAAAKTQNNEKAASAPSSRGTYLADSVKPELSSKAKDMATAKAVATQAPDVREEKIAELKLRIAAGKYEVSPQAVADRMVDDHLELVGS